MQQKRNTELDDKLDDQFVRILRKIQQQYLKFNRHIQIRIQKWVEKLLQYDQNTVWRKSRNNYICVLGQMVNKGKIQGVFLRMPPQKDIPNLTENQCRKITQDIKSSIKIDTHANHQVFMKKIQSINGDTGSELITPNCQTDRVYDNKQLDFQAVGTRLINQLSKKQQFRVQKQNKPDADQKLIQKIYNLLARNQEKLNKDDQFNGLVYEIQNKFHFTTNSLDNQSIRQQQSTQLRVQQGVQNGKANLFQFGSPRGMTQMQYFRAALQL